MKTPILLRFLRYTRGYVRFTVSGKYPERFLNITARNRVRLWEVRREKARFCACMYSADYKKIRTLAKDAGVVLRVTEKYGLPTFLARFRDHSGVLIGASAFIIAVFVMSQFIWSVDITGLDTLGTVETKELLREHGLYVGAFKPSIDDQALSRELMLECHEIGWMAVNIEGSYASVEIKEEAPAPEVEDISYPCNIKAKRDGVIRRLEVKDGDTALTEGSGVIAGQLLVSGVMGSEEKGYRLVHARAQVMAETTHEARFSVPENAAVWQRGEDTAAQGSVKLLGWKIPYRFGAVNSPYAVTQERTEAPAPLGVQLPLSRIKTTVYAMESREEELDDNSAKELLMKRSRLYELFTLSDCTVEKRDQRMIHADGEYTIYVTYTCEEDIAYQEEIGVE